jgi:hypothetical protein
MTKKKEEGKVKGFSITLPLVEGCIRKAFGVEDRNSEILIKRVQAKWNRADWLDDILRLVDEILAEEAKMSYCSWCDAPITDDVQECDPNCMARRLREVREKIR